MLLCWVVFLAGVLQAGMQSFNGELQGYIGLMGTSLVTHVVGGLLLVLYLLGRRERIVLGPMPWKLYSAGIFGLMLVAGTSLCVARIGTALTTCLSISGQLLQSILMDHFGWMGVKKTDFARARVPCLLVILAGLVLMQLGGQGGPAAGAAGLEMGLYSLLALALGGINVYSKAVNFQAAEHLGTASGTLVNYVTASALSAALLAAEVLGGQGSSGAAEMAARFSAAPVWLYLGGVFGVVAMVMNVLALKGLSLFQSTTFLLLGQLVGSAVLEALWSHGMPPVKILGVAIVGAGVAWDQKVHEG